MYINTINELAGNENTEAQAAPSQFQHILTTIEYNNIYKIVLNRPTKLNAINIQVNKSNN